MKASRGTWILRNNLRTGLAGAGMAALLPLGMAAQAEEPEAPPAAFLEPFPDVMAHVNGTDAADSATTGAEPVATAATDDATDDAVEHPSLSDPIGGPLSPDMLSALETDGLFRGSAALAEALGPAISRAVAFGEVPRVESGPVTATLVVESGDTMAGLFTDAGIAYGEALAAIDSLDGVWDPRQLRVGQHVDLTFVPIFDQQDHATLVAFAMDLAYDRRVTVTRTEDGDFSVQDETIRFETALNRSQGTINASLYADGNAAGIPNGILAAMTRAFSYDVDFQREIQPGDSFEAVFEQSVDADGTAVATGSLIYGALTLSGKLIEIYRFERGDGSVDYFTPEGTSVRKALLRTPVDAVRISSGFGMRQHPILGYSRMHSGIDFAASTGTPVYAAGDGTIEVAGWNHGYGNYVRIRHNGTTETAYGHLSRYASGIHPGVRVEQGQVIAYVGSTGLATGPHLHYEVRINGSAVNPANVQMPPGDPLTGDDLERFQAWRATFDQERLAIDSGRIVETAAVVE